MRFENSVVIITGGAGRIGGAIAESFLAEGASIAIVDLPASPGEDFARQLSPDGSRASFHPGDVSSSADVEAMVNSVVSRYGKVDVLINCAGWTRIGDATTMDEADVDRVFATHIKGTWLTCKYTLPHMMSAGRGAIVNISSAYAHKVVPGRSIYGPAKAAISAITRQLALEYGPAGIRVNAVCPAVIRSEEQLEQRADPRHPEVTEEEYDLRLRTFPLRRLGSPRDVAGPVLFLASDRDASWVTGVDLLVDGGLTIQLAEAVAYPPFYRLWQHNVPQA